MKFLFFLIFIAFLLFIFVVYKKYKEWNKERLERESTILKRESHFVQLLQDTFHEEFLRHCFNSSSEKSNIFNFWLVKTSFGLKFYISLNRKETFLDVREGMDLVCFNDDGSILLSKKYFNWIEEAMKKVR